MQKAKAAKSRQKPHKPAKSRKSQNATCRRGTGNAEDAKSQKATKRCSRSQEAETPRSQEAKSGKKQTKKNPNINTPPFSIGSVQSLNSGRHSHFRANCESHGFLVSALRGPTPRKWATCLPKHHLGVGAHLAPAAARPFTALCR